VRRYLEELDALPSQPLVAGVLASLRAAMGDTASSGGNAISMIFADLATETADVPTRAVRVTASTKAGKQHLLGLRRDAAAYSSLMALPWIATTGIGQGHRFPPICNLGLSNVPGTDVPLFLGGAKAEAMHGTTVLGHGNAVIVTVTNWVDDLAFTVTACPDAVPHSQRLATYLADELDAVEQALEGP